MRSRSDAEAPDRRAAEAKEGRQKERRDFCGEARLAEREVAGMEIWNVYQAAERPTPGLYNGSLEEAGQLSWEHADCVVAGRNLGGVLDALDAEYRSESSVQPVERLWEVLADDPGRYPKRGLRCYGPAGGAAEGMGLGAPSELSGRDPVDGALARVAGGAVGGDGAQGPRGGDPPWDGGGDDDTRRNFEGRR